MSLWDVQAGIYDCLTGDGALTALLPAGAAAIADHIRPQLNFPYIAIGEALSRPMDTQTGRGGEITVTIHSYSRTSGMKEIKQIMGGVSAALHHADFYIAGQALILSQEISSEAFLEGDGETRHGLQRFQIITEPL